MCGRFALSTNTETLKKRYNNPQMEIELFPNNNISPGMMIPVVIDSNGIQIEQMKWGLVPSWAKDPKVGMRLINARAETVAEKPAFRKLFATRRCLIPATGFYEWEHKEDGLKVPYIIRVKNQEIISLAGLWDEWLDAEKYPLRTCTVITTEANNLLKPIHERMPVILSNEQEALWLSETQRPEKLQAYLQPYDTSDMEIKS